ncbi:Uma2 family endonuclease [Kitasatospora viridis]|uniref:Putative restriction endonuclease n=1 Tax=Kitasatospora viridis TaxID=281105 RepID=A0A561UJL7_9ACTN|nr:Uma2 family endonuclease [Kitasatospora viridis]TWF99554.1 putative restriction endonuclease [Kitasatospora viridis]
MSSTVPTDAHGLVRLLESLPEFDAYRVELIDGKIVLLPSATPFHNLIQVSVSAQLHQQGWAAMTEQALCSPDRSFEPKPDVIATGFEQIEDNANPLPAERVLLTVEIVSTDRDSDYAKKRLWYAASGVPLYLIIDPNDGLWELHSGPRGALYRIVERGEFGEAVELPAPFTFALDTAQFKLYPPRPGF